MSHNMASSIVKSLCPLLYYVIAELFSIPGFVCIDVSSVQQLKQTSIQASVAQ